MSDAYWDDVYSRTSPGDRSWTEGELPEVLELVELLDLARNAAVVDIGAGASAFIKEMVRRGYADLTAVDISSAALNEARRELGANAAVTWLVSDVTRWEPTRHFALWHDRATLHFLTEASQQAQYWDVVRRALEPGGHALVSTFAEDGPASCSGLAVRRWSLDELSERVRSDFDVVATRRIEHRTPWGATQPFNTWLLQRRS